MLLNSMHNVLHIQGVALKTRFYAEQNDEL